jgi:hypothetical protein
MISALKTPARTGAGGGELEGPCSLLSRGGIALWLSLSKALAVADSGECRDVHDCALAADRTTPSNRQWTNHLTAIAMGLGMLHCGIPNHS